MTISTWDEIRTAFHVARLGTVSGAAEALGVHHATVIRHIDALEEQLGVKLFQRHARGYTATEAGSDLLLVAQATDDQFTQLVGRIKGRGDAVSGELVVTSLPSSSPKLTPALAKFQKTYPEIVVRYLTGERLFRLEYGEAHVAVRAGRAPENPDNVVQPFTPQPISLYASDSYIEANGRPESLEDIRDHKFVAHDNFDSHAPFNKWLHTRVDPSRIVFRGTDERIMRDALCTGVGIGFLSTWEAQRFPNLVQLFPPLKEWEANLWLVTHVDLHRTTKVQTFLRFLKEEAKSW